MNTVCIFGMCGNWIKHDPKLKNPVPHLVSLAVVIDTQCPKNTNFFYFSLPPEGCKCSPLFLAGNYSNKLDQEGLLFRVDCVRLMKIGRMEA